jgi:tRNA threonylcarbamoyl adenosine modification protein YeaZ
MFSLFIDTTQQYCLLAILKNKVVVKSSKIPTHNNLTDVVVEHIKKLLAAVKIKYNQIENIYVVIGPGSFTGVRVSTTVTKGMVLANKSRIYAIDSLTMQLPKLHGISILDARGDNFYVSIYKNKKMILKPKMVNKLQLKKLTTNYKALPIYSLYENISIFDHLATHLPYFKLITDIKKLTPLYIKKPL